MTVILILNVSGHTPAWIMLFARVRKNNLKSSSLRKIFKYSQEKWDGPGAEAVEQVSRASSNSRSENLGHDWTSCCGRLSTKSDMAGVVADCVNCSCILSNIWSRSLRTWLLWTICGTLGRGHCLIHPVPSHGFRDLTMSSTFLTKYSFFAILHCRRNPCQVCRDTVGIHPVSKQYEGTTISTVIQGILLIIHPLITKPGTVTVTKCNCLAHHCQWWWAGSTTMVGPITCWKGEETASTLLR